jgi:GNAT superfamily N-acetyltransferase
MDLAVTKQWRRKGIGVQLFNAAKQWFDSSGVKRVEVRVATSNETALGFWRKLGFKPYMETMYLDTC